MTAIATGTVTITPNDLATAARSLVAIATGSVVTLELELYDFCVAGNWSLVPP